MNIVASVDARERSHNDDGKITTDTHIANKGSEIVAGGDLTIISSGGDITLQASHLGGESITLSAEDTIHFATATDQHSHVESGKSSNGITQTQYNNGRSTEDLVYTTMDIGSGGLTVEAEQIIIDYLSTIKNTTLDKKGEEQLVSMFTQSPQDAINQLINNPGMGWLAQVTNDGSLNITYNGQTITNTEWDHDQTTLTPAAAVVIAVVVSVITAGAGSAIGAAAGLTVGATSGTASVFTAIGGTIAQGLGLSATGAVAAGIGAGVGAFTSSVISGTIIGAINGDLDMGSVLMNALASGLTAGILQGLNQGVFANSIDNVLANNTNWQNLTAENYLTSIAKIGVNSTVSAGIRTALLGGDFEDNFLDALRYNAANVIVEPIGFNIVGDIIGSDAGSVGAALLYAVIGAAGGYISGRLEGLQGGALGAFLGELVVSGETSNSAGENMLAVQQIIGGLASLAVGDASMAGVDAAVNAFIYNRLSHEEKNDLQDAIQKRSDCQNGKTECDQATINALNEKIAEFGKKNNDPEYQPAWDISVANDASGQSYIPHFVAEAVNDPFIAQHINDVWVEALLAGTERGFFIYQLPNGTYMYSDWDPSTATETSINVGLKPTGGRLVAMFHTHQQPLGSKDKDGIEYSPDPSNSDHALARQYNLPGVVKGFKGMYY